MSQENINDIVKFFLTLKTLNKLYHWNTKSYARHKASDGFGEDLDAAVDKFVEVFIGRYKVKPMINRITIDQNTINDAGMEKLLLDSKRYLEAFETMFNDKDLLTIRDDILASINKTLYLFQLT